MGRILFIRGGAVGDFILTMPSLRLVRETLPDNEIEILGYPSIASLALAAGLADRVRPLEDPRLATFFAPGAKLDPEWCAYFAGFDVVVSCLYDPDGHFAGNLRVAGVKTLIPCPYRPDETPPHVPAAVQFAKPLESLGLFLDDAGLDLAYAEPQDESDSSSGPNSTELRHVFDGTGDGDPFLARSAVGTHRRGVRVGRAPASATDAPAVRPYRIPSNGDLGQSVSPLHSVPLNSAPLVALHPGSGSPRKNWGYENWITVLSALHRERPELRFLVTSGEAEAETIGDFLDLMADAGLPHEHLVGRPLAELGAIYRHIEGFLGHDSGLSHLAASAGARGLLLFGPTEPGIWAPVSQRMRVLRSPDRSMGSLSVAEVMAEVRELFTAS